MSSSSSLSSTLYQQPSSSVSGAVTTPEGDMASLTFEPIDEMNVMRGVRDPSAGATCVFVGTTRDCFEGKNVARLEYEAYSSLALKTMHSILQRARSPVWPPPSTSSKTSQAVAPLPGTTQPYPTSTSSSVPSSSAPPKTPPRSPQAITRIQIVHRLGHVPVCEPSIIVAVSSPHRRESFEVAEWALEEVKKEVQIWKREVYDGLVEGADGSRGTHGLPDPAWKENFPAGKA